MTASKATLPTTDPITPILEHVATMESYRQAKYQEAVQQSKLDKLDDAPPGGRFVLMGQLVDCNGQPISEGEPPQ